MNRQALGTINAASGSKLPILASKPKAAAPEVQKQAPAKRKAEIDAEAPAAKSAGKAPSTKVAAKPAASSKATTITKAALSKTAPMKADAAKKRPTWDYKGRLEDMEKLALFLQTKAQTENTATSQLTDMMKETCERIIRLESQRAEAWKSDEVDTTEAIAMIKTLEDDIVQNKKKHQEEIEEMQSKFSRQLRDINETLGTTTEDRDEQKRKLSHARDQIDTLTTTISKMAADSLAMESQQRALKAVLEATQQQCSQREADIRQLTATIAAQQNSIEQAEEKARADEIIRRKLHNTIQELKGNIRVFCRIRPLMPMDGDEYHGKPQGDQILVQDEQNLQIQVEESNYAGKSSNKVSAFQFDKVFPPSSSQSEVFEEISQLVQSALDGYNICIFAYGQTGSGKTHTMGTGDNAHGENRGMVPRAMEQIFSSAKALKEKGWQYEMKACFLEIYNETIRDLLGAADDDKKHDIKKGANQETIVTDIEECTVNDESQVYALLARAAKNRSVARTHMNEQSSRSHSVFRLTITGKNTVTDDTCRSALNLVDLAGSERLAQSGSTGDRLKETQSINKSLSNLGNVIMALGSKEAHVPYRNSKLTYLLQDSLGGNSKTLMFVNINPREDSVQETLCSLRFATKVNQCNIGTAQTQKAKSDK